MEVVTGEISITPATTKGGKNFLKITVGDKYMYDWNFLCPKMGIEDGMFVKAEHDGSKFPKLKTIAIVSKQKQDTVTEASNKPASGAVRASYSGSPSNCKQYLCLKLAVEYCDAILAKNTIVTDEMLQWLENCYKKIKSLWEDG